VTVYPLTLIVAEPRLQWDSLIRPRDEALQHADSLIELFLEERAPEADWVMPAELRRMARQAPGMLADPEQMGTALLRADGLTKIPDPLRSQMRRRGRACGADDGRGGSAQRNGGVAHRGPRRG
jgi:hypothetical protein